MMADVLVVSAPAALTPLLEGAAATAGIYLFLVVLLRVLGRRQLGQLTVIDLVVVLLLGSAVETAMIHGNTSLPVGLTSAATLLIVNRGLTTLFLRSSRLAHLVNGGPLMLVRQGRVLEGELLRAGMTEADLLEALRARGFAGPAGVEAAVLETDGTVSVVGVDSA
jgi:uncharacterized membrane protein YcaP (DUF421 family)